VSGIVEGRDLPADLVVRINHHVYLRPTVEEKAVSICPVPLNSWAEPDSALVGFKHLGYYDWNVSSASQDSIRRHITGRTVGS